MPNSMRPLAVATNSLLLALAATSQQPLPVVPIPPTLHEQVLTDTTTDGAIWAGAWHWKARFAAEGTTFHAHLGTDVESRHATFSLQSVQVGNHALSLAKAQPVLGDHRITIDHSCMQERFELGPAGIEQQFVFTTLPERAALQVDVAVATDLATGFDGAAHTFRCADGGVRYGGATVIDAAGRSLALTTTWTGSALRITVPAAFVATAELPLCIDPLIGTTTTANTTNSVKELSSTDIAFDASLGQYYVCYERFFSPTDHDVYLAWFDTSMQPLGLGVVDLTTENWTAPRVATLEAHDVGCVVAQTGIANQTPTNVSRRIFQGGSTITFSAVGTWPLGSTENRVTPDIGGDSDPVGPSNFLIVWEKRSSTANNTDVVFSRIDPNGNQLNTGVTGAPIGFKRRPAISKTCGKPGSASECWAIVYRFEPYQQTVGRLQALFCDRSGNLHFTVNNSYSVPITGYTDNGANEWDVSSPTDHELGRTFLCAESRLDAGNGNGEILGHAFDRLGQLIAGDVTLLDSSQNRHAPAVDCDGCRFGVASTNVYGGLDVDVRVATAALVGTSLVVQDGVTVSFSGDADAHPGICAQRGQGPNLYGVAWTHGDGTGWTVQAQRYNGIGAGGFSSRATACGTIGIVASGSSALGESFSITLTNVTAIGGFLAGTPTYVPIPPCPGCGLGVDGQTLLGSQLQVQVPFDTGLVGATLAVQGVQFDPAGGTCLNELQFSNTIDVRVR